MQRYGTSFLTYMICDNRSQEPGNKGIRIRKSKSCTGSNQKMRPPYVRSVGDSVLFYLQDRDRNQCTVPGYSRAITVPTKDNRQDLLQILLPWKLEQRKVVPLLIYGYTRINNFFGQV
jgi:hypothetical protein